MDNVETHFRGSQPTEGGNALPTGTFPSLL
jgi:hypothetical protein